MLTLMLRTAPPEATGFPAEQYGAAAKLITDYLKGEGDSSSARMATNASIQQAVRRTIRQKNRCFRE